MRDYKDLEIFETKSAFDVTSEQLFAFICCMAASCAVLMAYIMGGA